MITRHTTNIVLDTPSRSLFPPCLVLYLVPFFVRIQCPFFPERVHLSKSSLSDAYRSIPSREALTPARNVTPKHPLFRSSPSRTPSYQSLSNGAGQMASARLGRPHSHSFLKKTHYTEKTRGYANYRIPCKKATPPQKLTRNTPCYRVGVGSLKSAGYKQHELRIYRSEPAAYGDCGKTPSRGLRPDRSIAPGWPLHSAESAQQKSVMVHG